MGRIQVDSMQLKAVIFDWAGTLVDHGSRAPVAAFVDAFAAHGVHLTEAEARVPMGLSKREHVRALLEAPQVRARWRDRHGEPPAAADLERVYSTYLPLNVAAAAAHAQVIPGVVETVAQLRARGLRIGSTTGYTRAIMAAVHELAESQGLAVDDIVCADDVPVGRPSPLMIYRAMISLAVWPAASVVKVDDTAAGIAEGLAAGCWTIGVVMTGNEVGLSADSLAAMAPAERDALRERGRDALLRAGAHRVVDSVAGLGPVIDELDARLGDGETPRQEALGP